MLKIHVLNVGLGDSIVLETVSDESLYYSLVDCKKVVDKVPTVQFLDDRNICHIQSLFISHLHVDHISGIPALVEYLKKVKGTLQYIVSPLIPQEAEIYMTLLKQHDKTQKRTIVAIFGALYELLSFSKAKPVRILFEGAENEHAWNYHLHPNLLFAPVSPKPEEAVKPLLAAIHGSPSYFNDISHAMLVRHEAGTYIGLLTGDLDSKIWRYAKNRCLAITKKEIRSKLRFFKVPHHGAYNGTMSKCLEDLIDADTPFCASISCPSGDVKHPHKKTLDFLKNHFPNCSIACTNLSPHCASLNVMDQTSLFNAPYSVAEFFDFTVSQSFGTVEREMGPCAGDHIIEISDTGHSLIRSSDANCLL